MADKKDWRFQLSDKLEEMAIITRKIYAVADQLFMNQSGSSNPMVEIVFDYALDAYNKAQVMAREYCNLLLEEHKKGRESRT